MFQQFKRLIFNRKTLFQSLLIPFMTYSTNCVDYEHLNKSKIVQFLNSRSQQYLLFVYNHYISLEDKAVLQKLEHIKKIISDKKLGIDKIGLIDDAELRHLKIYQSWLEKEKIQQKNEKSKQDQGEYENQETTRQNPLSIYYSNPNFIKPFLINEEQFQDKIATIRGLLEKDQEKIKNNLKIKLHTTVIKTCVTNKCEDQFKENLRKLIEMRMFEKKNYKFGIFKDISFLSEQFKSRNVEINKTEKQNTYVMRYDLIGKDIKKYSEFYQKDNQNQPQWRKLIKFIKPRVHIFSKNFFQNDLAWYITSHSQKKTALSFTNTQDALFNIQLFRKLFSAYNHTLQFLIIDTNKTVQIFRHSFQSKYPWVIFNLTQSVPYPKKYIHEDNMLDNLLKYQHFTQQINTYLKNPQIYDLVELEKQIQITSNELIQKITKFKENQKIILRVCKGKCIPKEIKAQQVYVIDCEIHNIGLKEGNYLVEKGMFTRLQ